MNQGPFLISGAASFVAERLKHAQGTPDASVEIVQIKVLVRRMVVLIRIGIGHEYRWDAQGMCPDGIGQASTHARLDQRFHSVGSPHGCRHLLDDRQVGPSP